MTEFDRQVAALTDRKVHTVAGMTAPEFTAWLEPLRAQTTGLEGAGDAEPADQGSDINGVPFVVMPAPNRIEVEQLVPLMTLAGGSAPGVVDRNHGEFGLAPYMPLPELAVDPTQPYLLVAVERGEEFCGVRPKDAVAQLSLRGRTPLTILEGVMLQLIRPEVLQPNRCFMLAGSRRGDKRVPALWISARAPKLGWCWEGNPHTWLGTASAAGRVRAG